MLAGASDHSQRAVLRCGQGGDGRRSGASFYGGSKTQYAKSGAAELSPERVLVNHSVRPSPGDLGCTATARSHIVVQNN